MKIKLGNASFLFFILIAYLLVAQHVNASTCSPNPVTSGDSVTFSYDCENLQIDGVGATVSIANGVTILGVSQNPVTINSGSNQISILNNGSISASGTQAGIDVYYSNLSTLNNTGTISATGDFGMGIVVRSSSLTPGSINTLTNSGNISVENFFSFGILNSGNISKITNLGSIQAGTQSAAINNAGQIGLLDNSGHLTVGDGSIAFRNSGTIDAILNSGFITSGSYDPTFGSPYSIYNEGGSSRIGSIVNTGQINSGNSGYAVFNAGVIGVIDNRGTISAGDNGIAIYNNFNSRIDLIENSGLIISGSGGSGILSQSGGSLGAINNLGRIEVGESGYGVIFSAPTNAVNNYGLIQAGNNGYGIVANASANTISNNGVINIGNGGFGIAHSSNQTLRLLDNSGQITIGDGGNGIYNTYSDSRIVSLNNSGTISVGNGGFGLNNSVGAIIDTLNNTGAITTGSGGFGILNSSTITTINNLQGGNSSSPSTIALTYSGELPTNYNIGISSPTHYGQLFVDPSTPGTITNFGIYGTPFLTSRTYSSVLTNNVTVTNLQNTYDNMSLSLVANGNYWDLIFTGASLMGTQQSLVNTANSLAPIFTLQNSVLANSLSYDCNVFGANDVCISAGGRNTAVSAANGLNNTSALLIAAYRPHPNYRIGAYADQNLSVNNAGSTVSLGNNTPLIGLFGAWNERLDGAGTEVKVSAAYGQKNTAITRQVVGLSEAGSGSSQLNSQGAQITAKYGFGFTPDVIVSPYVGLRYTQNNMGGYTEQATSSVTAPLTYSALNTNATTALAGIGVQYRFIPKATAFVSAGVETDTNTNNGTYSATGIVGLTPVNFNANPVKTRPTATIGAYYDVEKNQRLGITGIYRQEPYQAVSTTTVMATYMVGL